MRVPIPPKGHGYAYVKQKRKIGDYATAAAAVVLTFDKDKCKSAAVGLTNVGDTPLYAAKAGAALEGSAIGEDAIAAVQAKTSPPAAYKGSTSTPTS